MRYFYQNFVLERDLLEWLALLGLHIIFNLSSWLERKWYLLLTLKLNGFNEVMMGATFFTGGTGLGTGLVTQDLIWTCLFFSMICAE